MAGGNKHNANQSQVYLVDPRRKSEAHGLYLDLLSSEEHFKQAPPVPPKDLPAAYIRDCPSTTDSFTIPDRVEATGEKRVDPQVSFEEYVFWARYSRADERYEDPSRDYKVFGKTVIKSRNGTAVENLPYLPGCGVQGKKTLSDADAPPPSRLNVTDEDWVAASRAVRTATWGVVFYLITTDILGPFATPYAFAALGYGPGISLFTAFGAGAAYGGWLLWRMFLGLDSDRYPLLTYGDIAFRIYGRVARHCVNGLQSIQLLFNVGIILVGSGLALEQIITGAGHGSVCFIILCFVWAVFGMLIGQIRTLRNIGYLAHAAIWMNVFVMVLTMAVVPSTGIQAFAAISANGQFNIQAGDPIRRSAGVMPDTSFVVQINGLGQAVYSYGGAMLFVEFMAEMRRPFDFWKAMLCAQLFIYLAYILFGVYVYTFQGQYVLNPSTQGIGSYLWLTVGNSLTLVSGMIAALIYGNVGLKVVYRTVMMDMLGAPSLASRAGKLAWVACVPSYWVLAFILAAAIPQITNLGALIAAVCIIQFSYTFPPLLMVGYLARKHAMLPGDGFDPRTGITRCQDGGWRRYWRGVQKRPYFNAFNLLFALGSATCAVLGIYSAAVGIRIQYATGTGTSFSCLNPYGEGN